MIDKKELAQYRKDTRGFLKDVGAAPESEWEVKLHTYFNAVLSPARGAEVFHSLETEGMSYHVEKREERLCDVRISRRKTFKTIPTEHDVIIGTDKTEYTIDSIEIRAGLSDSGGTIILQGREVDVDYYCHYQTLGSIPRVKAFYRQKLLPAAKKYTFSINPRWVRHIGRNERELAKREAFK